MNEKIPVIYLHPVLLNDFKAWLTSRGIDLVEYPEHLQNEEGATQYFVIPKGI